MKKLALYLFLCISTFAYGEVLLTEDFDYNIGEELCNHGWFTTYGSLSGVSVTSGLEMSGYAGCGIGGAALLDLRSSSNQAHKSFRTVTGGDVYISFMMQPTINLKNGYFFCLRDNQVNGTVFNFNARVFLSQDYHPGLTFADNNKAEYNEQITLDPNEVYLFVLKYSVISGNNNDEVSLYIFKDGQERPDAETAATPAIGRISDSNKPDISPANVVLRGYDEKGWLVIDGIRVATTWSEAIAKKATGDCGKTGTGISEHNENKKNARKIIENGQIYILRNGERFSILGNKE